MFDKIKVKNKKPRTIAYIQYEGEYKDIPYEDYIDRLYSWSKKKRLGPGMRPMSIYLDEPDKKPKSKVRIDIAIPIRKKISGEGKIEVRDLPATKVATMKFKGSSEEYEKAYSDLWHWIKEKNFKISGAPIEYYLSKPKMVKGKQIIKSRIEIPIE